MTTLLAKHDPDMVLQMGSSLILINVPNGQNMALLWPKYEPHMVLKISSSLILINVPRDVPCQNSHFWVYPVAPFPRKGQNVALLEPKHGPHIFFQIATS